MIKKYGTLQCSIIEVEGDFVSIIHYIGWISKLILRDITLYWVNNTPNETCPSEAN